MSASSKSSSEILNSWKQIAGYLNAGVRTVQRWEAEYGLPVRRPGRKRHSVIAIKSEIDGWLKSRWLPGQVEALAPPKPAADAGTAGFIQVEIESGLTFANLARSARPNDREKIERNMNNAQKAYDTALKFRHRLNPDATAAARLDAGLERLKNVLQQMRAGR